MDCIDGMVNPFSVKGEDLKSINSGVVDDVKGKSDFLQARVVKLTTSEFLIALLIHQITGFHKTIKQAKLKTCSNLEKTMTTTKTGKTQPTCGGVVTVVWQTL